MRLFLNNLYMVGYESAILIYLDFWRFYEMLLFYFWNRYNGLKTNDYVWMQVKNNFKWVYSFCFVTARYQNRESLVILISKLVKPVFSINLWWKNKHVYKH